MLWVLKRTVSMSVGAQKNRLIEFWCSKEPSRWVWVLKWTISMSVGAQKNSLNETVILNTQNIFHNFTLSWPSFVTPSAFQGKPFLDW